jgi:D-tyrosyl-tRNA(Tyr) deacylase
MRAVIQRVSSCEVDVDGVFKGRIGPGLLVFLGVEAGDEESDLDWLVRKIPGIRCFEDGEMKMNRSLLDLGGEAMVISQFTLFGSLKKGTRPSFNRASPPDVAEALYERFAIELEKLVGRPVVTGGFGRHMTIRAENDGPVTLILDTRRKDV